MHTLCILFLEKKLGNNVVLIESELEIRSFSFSTPNEIKINKSQEF